MTEPGRRAARTLRDLGLTAGMLAAAAGLCFLLGQVDHVAHSDAYVSMLFILAVFLTARFTSGYAWGIGAALVSVLLVNFFFTYPYFAFNFLLPGYPITVACMLAVSLLTSAMTTRIKQVEQLRGEAAREKMRGNLLRAVSHDFRTPLTAIMGANSTLAESGAQLTPEERARLHRNIAEDAQWLLRMVENLLTVTRIREETGGGVEKTPQLPEEVVAEAVDKFHRHYPEREVTVSVPETAELCPMDPMLVEQVLLNLMENAVIHGGAVRRIALTVSAAADEMRFCVEDDRGGVSREQLRHFFEDRAPAGTGDGRRNMGIGLSVCQAIVAAHGGRMWAEHAQGGGLAVSFALPMKGEEA